MSSVKYSAGLYMRLSKEDERSGESVSIENQRLLLTKYAEDRGFDISETYIDDGFSGTTMQRPAFQRMMQDVEDKRINLILVKDLSRIGRNYLEVGRLTEETLPRLGCHFVALNDSVDSMLGDNDMMVYRNLFNEFYSKDTSKKVRAVKQACMRQGKFLGTYAPLGYTKDPMDKHRLIIDEETAPIVRRIFQLRCSGMGHCAISYALNEDGVPSSREIWYSKQGRKKPTQQRNYWMETTVKNILCNEAYIGNMVQGKSGTVSYKNRKQIGKPEESWIRVENTHEPLISKEEWDIVRTMENSGFKPRADSGGDFSIFAGVLKCADCGYVLRKHLARWKRKDGTIGQSNRYICSLYNNAGKTACSSHIVHEDALIELISADIREHAKLANYNEERVLQTVLNIKNSENKTYLATYQRELKSAEVRLQQLGNTLATLYEDKVNGVVTEAIFKNLAAKYEAERAEKSTLVSVLSDKVAKCQKDFGNADAWLQSISKYMEMETLTTGILLELIDSIEVFEAEGCGRKKVCQIRINYRFIGHIGDALLDTNGSENKTEGVDAYVKAV